jgi:hypothetical protein
MKRIYFEYDKTVTTTTKQKGYIEIDDSYTQLYDCFLMISPKIRSITSFHLLFWLLAVKMNKVNGFDSSRNSYLEFNDYLLKNCDAKNCGITYRTFINCMNELVDSNAIVRAGKGHYYASFDLFFRGPLKDRIDLITEEAKYNKYKEIYPSAKLLPELLL